MDTKRTGGQHCVCIYVIFSYTCNTNWISRWIFTTPTTPPARNWKSHWIPAGRNVTGSWNCFPGTKDWHHQWRLIIIAGNMADTHQSHQSGAQSQIQTNVACCAKHQQPGRDHTAATNIFMKSTSAMDNNNFHNTVVKRAKKCAATLPKYRGSWTQIKNESGRNLLTVRRAILDTNPHNPTHCEIIRIAERVINERASKIKSVLIWQTHRRKDCPITINRSNPNQSLMPLSGMAINALSSIGPNGESRWHN